MTDPVDPAIAAVAPTPPPGPAGALPPSDGEIDTDDALVTLDCVATPQSGAVSCQEPMASAGSAEQPSDVFGGQGTLVQLASTGSSYVGTTFSMNVTLKNLTNEAIGTPDGPTLDPQGIRVFFAQPPTATAGTGTITILNADGTGTFTASNQAYYQYNEILAKNQTSSAKTWQFAVPNTVTSFTFRIYVSTLVQPLLVINEVLANPAGPPVAESTSEWFELYNAGTRAVELQGLVIADSAASGRRPYHLISSSVVVPSGGYVVLGSSTNPSLNLGTPVDYAYGNALQLANSLDAVKVARVVGTDTLTLDRTQYSNAATSAQDAVSRELKNPALDNSNMDGSNWASALPSATYSGVYAGNTYTTRGTPKAQNSTFTSSIRLADSPYRWPGARRSTWERQRLRPPSILAAQRFAPLAPLRVASSTPSRAAPRA